MAFPSRVSIGNELQILIYERGGTRHQMRSCDTYAPVADKFHLDEATRNLTRDDCYGDGKTDSAWGNLVQWARKNLVDDGSLEKHAPHGIWQLTPKGVEEAQFLLSVRERISRSLRQLKERCTRTNPLN